MMEAFLEFTANFGMREWLFLCGAVLALVLVVDGIRKMRNNVSGKVKMTRAVGGGFPAEGDEMEEYGTELPNGGARVIHRDLDDQQEQLVAEGFSATSGESFESEPSLSAVTKEKRVSSTLSDESKAAEIALGDLADNFQDDMPDNPQENAKSNSVEDSLLDAQAEQLISEQRIIVLHVKSNSSNGFNGSDLLQILLACDLRYGERKILHRHEQSGGKGKLQFSVANMIEPGTFNLDDIGSFRTPGVTFFMGLPGPASPSEAFECLIETANCLVKNLDATLLDEHHEPATLSMIQQLREHVRSFDQASELV